MSSVEVLFKCILCGKAYDNVQSLRAHMKVHKKQGYVRTSIVAIDKEWKDFTEYAKRHNTTTCQLIGALIRLTLEGEKRGVVTVGSPNPIIFQLNEVFLGATRGRYSHFDARSLLGKFSDPALQRWPPNCDHVDKFFPWKDGKEIGCLDKREVVRLKECWICWYKKMEVIQA